MSRTTTLACVIRCQISNSLRVGSCIFALALTVSEIYRFQTFYLENVGQGNGVDYVKVSSDGIYKNPLASYNTF